MLSDSDHERDHTVQKGEFYLVDFHDDPEFQDNPHLFLRRDDRCFEEALLPNDLPDKGDRQKKVVATDDTVSREDLTGHLGQ